MKHMSRALAYVILLSVVMFTACSKDGPAGPAGAQGPAGGQGPQGQPGGKGEPGTANVIYSGWLDATFTQSPDWRDTLAAPKLEKTLLANAEVKVYFNVGTAAAPQVYPLPFFNGNFIINVYFIEKAIILQSNGNFSTGVENGQKVGQFRYVIIPGGTTARTASGINWDDYNEVKKHLGLQD